MAIYPRNPALISLLKGLLSNVLVVGAAVPAEIPNGGTANFKGIIYSSSLTLVESDEDFQFLIKRCQDLDATTPPMASFVCEYLLKYCGGHVFPVLKFVEHFFTDTDAAKYLVSENAFLKHFLS